VTRRALVLGAGGVLGAAWMTGALFAVELTGHFDALPATIAASVGAYAVSVLVMRRSILTEKIARRGRHILQEYTVDPLDFLQAEQVMSPEPMTLPGAFSVEDTVAFFTREAVHRSYPVIDAQGRLLGLVSRSEALRWRVEGGLPNTSLADALSDASQPFAFTHTQIGAVADLMVEANIGRIPIIDPDTDRVVGILSRHDLLKARYERRRSEVDRSRYVGTR
jgi:CBS domain-containing protein